MLYTIFALLAMLFPQSALSTPSTTVAPSNVLYFLSKDKPCTWVGPVPALGEHKVNVTDGTFKQTVTVQVINRYGQNIVVAQYVPQVLLCPTVVLADPPTPVVKK